MPDFQMTFMNGSKTTFDYIKGQSPCDPLVDTIHQSPAPHLAKFTGSETMSWSQAASSIVAYNDGSVYWNDPSSGQTFGVKIHAPVQVFGIGTAPYYQVAYLDGQQSKDWFTPVDGPGDVYEFPSSLHWTIRIRPTANHTTLSLSISILEKR